MEQAMRYIGSFAVQSMICLAKYFENCYIGTKTFTVGTFDIRLRNDPEPLFGV